MDTIFVSAITSLCVAGGLYWYLHKKNPDLAQKVTDTIKDAAVEDVKSVAEQAPAVVTEAIDAVKKD